MIIAAIGTWVVLAIGIDLALAYFTWVAEFSATTKLVLEQFWTFDGYYAARQLGAWVVCLVFFAVPLSGLIVSRRQRPAGDARDIGLRTRLWLKRVRPAALICLAGAVMVIAVTLVTVAVARARIAPGIRWNGVYFADFMFNEGQLVILVAVIFALIAAVRLTFAQSATIALAVGAIVAALGVLATMGSLTIGNCVAPFSITYTRAPAGDCPGNPGGLGPYIFPAAVEAVLIGILLVPAARYAGVLIARRSELSGRPALSVRALRWLAAGTAAVAVTVGIALLVPSASAHGVRPTGSIGQDGWVYGAGYEVRIFPNWYDLTPPADRGDMVVAYDGSYSGTVADLTLETVRVSPGEAIHGTGGRAFVLSGTRGLTFVQSDVRGYFNEQWLVIRGSLGYMLTFSAMVADGASVEPAVTAMLNSWHWNATTTPAPSSSGPAPAPADSRQCSLATIRDQRRRSAVTVSMWRRGCRSNRHCCPDSTLRRSAVLIRFRC